MSLRLIHAAAATLGARLLSALLSFLVFAQVAKALPPASSARVLFFSFAFGFALATFRTFHLVSAGVTGGESRSQRCRRIRAASRSLLPLTLWLAPATCALFVAQGVSWPVAVAALLLTVVCAHDLDLARAVVGRPPLLPWLTALGGLMGSALLLGPIGVSETVCAAAFLLQWTPVAAYQLWHGPRLLSLRARRGAVVGKDTKSLSATAGSFLVAIFDGAVLNAPFILALPLAAAAALDLALGNRLFVASLALFSLVGSWVVSGDLQRLAGRAGLSTAKLFAYGQFTLAAVIGGVYAGLYLGLAQQPVGANALAVFVFVLLAYVLHSTAMRFAVTRASTAVRVAVYGPTLVIFYTVMLWQRVALAPSLWFVVAAVVAGLTVPAAVMAWHVSRHRGP